jgi:hypothetical protein
VSVYQQLIHLHARIRKDQAQLVGGHHVAVDPVVIPTDAIVKEKVPFNGQFGEPFNPHISGGGLARIVGPSSHLEIRYNR